jgi:hypothetical protein
MRETETKSSEREIKSFREGDQELQVSGSIKIKKNTKTKCKSAPQMQKHKVSNDDCLMLLLFLSFFACFLDRLEMGTKNACIIYY